MEGIIPALAGNTAPDRGLPLLHWDHPRSRGEYDGCDGRDVCEAGSSPLSRGIRAVNLHEPPHGGIIPALAGNTICRMSSRCSTTDHPRSRGEYGRWGGAVGGRPR